MLNRRELAGLLVFTFPGGHALARDQAAPFFDSTGPELFISTVNATTATIRPRGSITLPASVQYAWPHPTRPLLYVASSDGVPGGSSAPGAPGNSHAVTALQIDAGGGLVPVGAALYLAARPIHLTVSGDGRFLLVAYNNPSHLTVHHIGGDGVPGAALPQPSGLDFGIYAHQVRMTPDGRSVALVTRGNDPAPGKPEDPGAIKLFGFQDGHLADLASIAPGNGLGFGPRHLDFHPRLPRAYVSLERQNALFVYSLTPDGGFTRDPLFRLNTLADPDGKAKHPGQGAGPIHVHPNGRFVYLANRGSGMVDFGGQRVWNGGENSIAVFALDGQNGAPTHVQSMDAHGFETRTFSIDPTGTLLVAASQIPMLVAEGGLHRVGAGLSFYRIGRDGRLTFLHRQDMDTTKGPHFWCGFPAMP